MTIEIVTRHLPARANLLARQQRSLGDLKADWIQTVLVDPAGRGVPASHRRLRTFEPSGDFVWLLDDDDQLNDPRWPHFLEPAADLHLFRMAYEWGLLPNDAVFAAHEVKEANIGGPCAVVRRDLWMRARGAWGDRYEGDFDFIVGAVQRAREIRWVDRPIAYIDRISRGEARDVAV